MSFDKLSQRGGFDDPHIEKATQEIDAAMFSGDAFISPAARAELRKMMERWQRGLLEWDAQEDEDPWCDDCDSTIGRDGCRCPEES